MCDDASWRLMTKFLNYFCYVAAFETHKNMETMISWWEICSPICIKYNIDWNFLHLDGEC